MPLDIDLTTAPYYSTFEANQNYQRILFKPSVPVQVREMNDLQATFGNQIESFADSVLERGTIVSGCSFKFFDYYPYIKIADLQLDGEPVNPAIYSGMLAKHGANLVSTIINFENGFESQDPDLNTLYLRYINAGNTNDQVAYSSNDVLTLYDSNVSIFAVDVPTGGVGLGFSNTDTLSIVPAIGVTVTSTNTFAVGELITQATTGARGVIFEVNTTSYPGETVLRFRPLSVDITNSSLTTAAWTFATGFNIVSNTTGSTASVDVVIGSGATGDVITDGLGRISDITMTSQGTDYFVAPAAVVKPANTSADVSTLAQLSPRNYLCQIRVASVANSVGIGYAFGVSAGTIYQKGCFSEVAEQVIVVSKYNQVPDQVTVGFNTTENIVDYTVDPTLLDNVSGSPSSQSPGADRLQLTPTLTLVTLDEAQSNVEFFPLVAFQAGEPYLQNRTTAFSVVGDEMARRTYETSGNFVVDEFLLGTGTANDESNSVVIFVDPGEAYISGERVQSFTNRQITVSQGKDTKTKTLQVASQYGGYFLVNELVGYFQHSTADIISIRDTAAKYISNTQNAGIRPANVGSQIATARLRTLQLASGIPGTPNATYRAYVYDINVANGKNIKDAKSIVYNGTTYSGIADVANATLASTNASMAMFPVGATSIRSVPTVSFQYYSQRSDLVANTSGIITNQLSGENYHPFNKSSTLANSGLFSMVVYPLANAQAAANVGASFALSSSSNQITRSTGSFLSDTVPGDFLRIWTNSTASDVRLVTGVVNSSTISVDRNLSATNAAANAVLYFPAFTPFVLSRTGRSANVDSTGKILTINLGVNLAANVAVGSSYGVLANNQAVVTKTSNRGLKVLLDLSTHSSSNAGPWSLGVADVYRLVSVTLGANVTAAPTGTDVTSEFHINSGQNLDYLDLASLALNSKSRLALTNTQALCVTFDAFTRSANGVATVSSYPIEDDLDYTTLRAGTKVNTHEVQTVVDRFGNYHDLIDRLDFRPAAANTVVLTSNAALANTNPSPSAALARFGNTANVSAVIQSLVQGKAITSSVNYYLGRTDRVILGKDGSLRVVRGKPSDAADSVAAPQPADSMTLGLVTIPPYPSVPTKKTDNYTRIIDTSTATQEIGPSRLDSHTVTLVATTDSFQPEVFTMADIGELERRIEDLEKQSSISALEMSIIGSSIPSSTFPGTSRFVYGFFADDFSSSKYTLSGDPEYTADITADKQVAPRRVLFNFSLKFNTANNTTSNGAYGGMLALLDPRNYTSVVVQSAATDTTDLSSHPHSVRHFGTMTATEARTGRQPKVGIDTSQVVQSDYWKQGLGPRFNRPPVSLNFED